MILLALGIVAFANPPSAPVKLPDIDIDVDWERLFSREIFAIAACSVLPKLLTELKQQWDEDGNPIPWIPDGDDDNRKFIWRGIGKGNPVTGDFHPRKPQYNPNGSLTELREGDFSGVSFYDSRVTIWAQTLLLEEAYRKEWRVGLPEDELVKAGFKIQHDGGQIVVYPNGRTDVNPPGHVSVTRDDNQQWDDWLNRRDTSYSETLREIARRQTSELNVAP